MSSIAQLANLHLRLSNLYLLILYSLILYCQVSYLLDLIHHTTHYKFIKLRCGTPMPL
uniref:Uncharacterized protein n=1 Tax=Physcomitrium patens TaxID=3218 RepID=A0A2K1ITQ1_PHYPA|nr:hypothetical protein PHYPA_024598 [Physcomitrium patens]